MNRFINKISLNAFLETCEDRKGQIFCGLKMIVASGSRIYFSGNFDLNPMAVVVFIGLLLFRSLLNAF